MGNWDNYRREEHANNALTGKHRCVIVDAQEKTSKSSGMPMIEITVTPSATKFKVKTYLVQGEYFNRNATQFFDAFPEIGDGNFNLIEWIGAEGAAEFGEDDQGYTKLKWFVSPSRAEKLPPFEGEKPERQVLQTLGDDDLDDDEMPFDVNAL